MYEPFVFRFHLLTLEAFVTRTQFIEAVIEATQRHKTLLTKFEFGFANTFTMLSSAAQARVAVTRV